MQFAQTMLAPFETQGNENPYTIHSDLQECMQDLVGIIRVESELNQALEIIQKLKQRSLKVKVDRQPPLQSGLAFVAGSAFAIDLRRSGYTGGDQRKESRGGHTRDDFPNPDPKFAKVNIVTRNSQRRDDLRARNRCRKCPTN